MILLLLISACHLSDNPKVDPDYKSEMLRQRQDREERLRAPDGWLTLVGLHWLEPGDNAMGHDPSAVAVLSAPGIPGRVGILRMEDAHITLIPQEGFTITIAQKDVDSEVLLKSDADPGGPDIMQIGRLSAYIIRRSDRFALRVKDPKSPRRLKFKGLDYFPIDPAFRVTARLEPYPKAIDVSISTAVGIDEHMLCPGILRFTILGQQLELLPWIENAEQKELFIVFQDATSGQTSYGAGRFLSAKANDEGEVILDFNRSYSPPCAFTPYATCPLAPPENELPIAIRAGERLEGGGGH